MFIDQVFMRKNEGAKIKQLFENEFNIDLIYVDAVERFHKKVEGVTDPEEKRKKIGEEFIRVFEHESKKLAGDYTFLAQGTLYPDVIESAVGDVSETAVKIDTVVQDIVTQCYHDAKVILTENREAMDRIVDILMDKETVDGDLFRQILSEYTELPKNIAVSYESYFNQSEESKIVQNL